MNINLGGVKVNKFRVCVLWLETVSLLFAFFGIIIALFNQTSIFQFVFSSHIDPVFWAGADFTVESLHFQQWIYGLLGATCLMLGILIFFIVKNAFAKKEKWAWNALFFSLIAWFMVDEPLSLYFKVYFNAAFNIVLLVAFCVPLLLTSGDFKRRISK